MLFLSYPPHNYDFPPFSIFWLSSIFERSKFLKKFCLVEVCGYYIYTNLLRNQIGNISFLQVSVLVIKVIYKSYIIIYFVFYITSLQDVAWMSIIPNLLLMSWHFSVGNLWTCFPSKDLLWCSHQFSLMKWQTISLCFIPSSWTRLAIMLTVI